MRSPSLTFLAHCGRIATGALLAGMGAVKIITALLVGRILVFTFVASLADQPILFLAMVAIWALVLASGLSYLRAGISGLWRNRDAGTAS